VKRILIAVIILCQITLSASANFKSFAGVIFNKPFTVTAEGSLLNSGDYTGGRWDRHYVGLRLAAGLGIGGGYLSAGYGAFGGGDGAFGGYSFSAVFARSWNEPLGMDPNINLAGLEMRLYLLFISMRIGLLVPLNGNNKDVVFMIGAGIEIF